MKFRTFAALALAAMVCQAGCAKREPAAPAPAGSSATAAPAQPAPPPEYQLSEPFPTLKEHEGVVRAVALSGDKKTLATGDDQRVLIIWDTPTWTVRRKIEEVGGRIGWPEMALSSDGKYLVVGEDLWNTQTSEKVRTLEGLRDDVHSGVAFSPDGKLLATGGGVLRLWDTATWKVKHALQGGTMPGFGGIGTTPLVTTSLTFSPDSKLLASTWSYDGGVKVFDTATGSPVTELKAGMPVAFSQDGALLGAQTNVRGGTFKTWDTATWQEQGKTEQRFNSCRFTSDKNRVIASFREDGEFSLVDLASGQIVASQKYPANELSDVIADISQDARVLVYGSRYDVQLARLPGQ